MRNTLSLDFKWTISRGRDTYGYNICSLLVDGYKKASCIGGGYDMQGTSFANWLNDEYQDRLLQLFDPEITDMKQGGECRAYDTEKGKVFHRGTERFYGVSIYYNCFKSDKIKGDGNVWISLDGACGMNSIDNIAKAIGIRLEWLPMSNKYKNNTFYIAHIDPMPEQTPAPATTI